MPAADTSTLDDRIDAVTHALANAAHAAGRDPASVALVAVSKTFPADAVAQAYAGGLRQFGENYVQEGCAKVAALTAAGCQDIIWHFIGPLQSNKSRMVAEHFDWVHGVDRESIARRLSEQRPAHLPPLRVCLQVNISGEASKSGVAPDAVADLAVTVSALPRLELRGLMCIPAPCDDAAAQRMPFRQLAALRDAVCQSTGLTLPDLSMGMSADYAAAIAEGATLVRIGSAIFGARSPRGEPVPASPSGASA